MTKSGIPTISCIGGRYNDPIIKINEGMDQESSLRYMVWLRIKGKPLPPIKPASEVTPIFEEVE